MEVSSLTLTALPGLLRFVAAFFWSILLAPWPCLHVHRVSKYKSIHTMFGCTWKPLISRSSQSCLCHFPSAHAVQDYGQWKFKPLPVQIFRLSLCDIHVSWEVNWFAVHPRSNCKVCSHPVCMSTADLISALEICSTYEPTVPNVCLWSEKVLSDWEELLAAYLAKGFK